MNTTIEKGLITVAVLTVLVNIITEVIKRAFDIKDAKIINIIVTVMSIVFSVVANIVYIGNATLQGIIASVVCGFLVAYSAMFGYDKLLSYLKPFTKG